MVQVPSRYSMFLSECMHSQVQLNKHLFSQSSYIHIHMVHMHAYTHTHAYMHRTRTHSHTCAHIHHVYAPYARTHIQMAYYRQYKCSVPTYESCSTAAFRHGRTETLRSATIATSACAEAFAADNSASLEEKGKFVREASAWHSRLTKEAAMGEPPPPPPLPPRLSATVPVWATIYAPPPSPQTSRLLYCIVDLSQLKIFANFTKLLPSLEILYVKIFPFPDRMPENKGHSLKQAIYILLTA